MRALFRIIPWLLIFGIFWQTPVYAAQAPLPHAIIVPAHENIDSVIAIHRPIIVSGTVTDSVISIGGDITLRAGSNSAFVLDIGGYVHQSPDATVTEGVVAITPDTPLLTTLGLAALMSAGGYFAYASLVALMFIWILAGGYVLRARHGGLDLTDIWKSITEFGLGLVITLVPLAVVLASFLTPQMWFLAILLSLIYLFMGAVGLIFVGNALGRGLGRMLKGYSDRWVPLYGAIAVLVIMNIPLIGPILWIGCWLLGLGAVWKGVMRRRKRPA